MTLNTRIKGSLNRLGDGWPLLALGLCLFAGAPARLLAQGTAFTYQGRLNDSGGPANGTYDLQFTVFDSGAGPNLVAGPLTNAVTAVSNGEFLVTLDFGDGVFTGPERWLEIAVRTNGNGAFAILSPRQLITPTPQAIYASNAGRAATAAVAASANSVSAANLTGTVVDSQLSSNIVRLTIPNTTTQATGGVVVTSGFITSANVTNGGWGYTLPPIVTVVDVSGSNAVIIASVGNGGVTNLAIQNAGNNYSGGATLTIAPPPSNAYQTFTSGNVFNGVSSFTSANNTFAGSFSGNGAGLTNVNLTGPSALSALGNTANGYQALHANTTGANNTANGQQALYSNTTGRANEANGHQALFSNTSGDYNTANGHQALWFNTSGSQNTATGYRALEHNTTGSCNDASGFQALNNNTTGSNNTANGQAALQNNTTGSSNVANGYQALFSNTTGIANTANGLAALLNNTSGIQNTASGVSALRANTTGANNVGDGFNALLSNATGNANTASGFNALRNSTNGSFNVAYGSSAIYSNTSGSYNIALGYQAGYNLATGSSNIDIGNPGFASDTNIIRIGSGQTQAFIAGIINGNGAGLTNLNASQLASGTLADARLSGNVALLNASPNFSGAVAAASFSGNGAGLTNLSADAITGGLTTNLAVLVPGGGTNTLCFTNGVLRAIQ
jgi:hypothetical protein